MSGWRIRPLSLIIAAGRPISRGQPLADCHNCLNFAANRHNVKRLVPLFALLLAAACATGPSRPIATADTPGDTLTLRLALVPDDDCLPFYYAVRAGLYDSLGLKVEAETYFSQFDADTALLGHADAGYTDSCRLALYQREGHKLATLLPTRGRWALVSSGSLRIRKISALGKRMVAASRHSASEALCRTMAAEARLPYDTLYHPQINDLRLRTDMLDGTQVETAMLPQPFASLALSRGHRSLWRRESRLGRIAARRRGPEAELLVRGYRQAVDSLRKHGKAAVRDILTDTYGLDATTIDTLTLLDY